MDETFLTTEEVLEYLQVNLRTVYRLIKAGKIPAVRVGRQWRFRKRDIDAWLDSQRPRGGSRAGRGFRRNDRDPLRDRERNGRAFSLSTTSRASATCCRRRWRLPSTTSIPHPTADRRWSGCACILTIAHCRPEDAGHRRAERHPRGQTLEVGSSSDHHHRLFH